MDPGWDNSYRHPRMTLRAGDLLASWAAHDAMHLRQMTNNHLRYLGRADAAYSTRYADA